jgi:gliding motility-associated-like protein
LSAGTYSVLVTDVNGCTTTNTVTLTQPTALTNTIAVSSNHNGQNISCNGLSDGSIDLTAAGGTTAYTYAWSNAGTTQDISGLTAGVYSVTITDVNGCTSTGTITLTQPQPIAIVSAITDVTCNGSANGGIDISVSGGTAGYNYSWSNASTTQDITGIAAGLYTVTVTDVNGCTSSVVDSVGQDQPLVLGFVTANVKCYNSFDGAINSAISGGVSPYQYSWSNGATTQNITGLDAGTYIISVTDSNSCVINDTIVILQPDSISAILTEYVYPNGFNVSLNGFGDGSVYLTVTGGTPSYTFLWSTGDTIEDLIHVPAGNYFVQITDSNGCVSLIHMTLTEPFELELPNGLSPNGDGKNDYFVIHGLESFPDNELWVYNRWGNLVFRQDDYKNDWAGISNNGGELPDATYFVVFKTLGNQQVTLTGYVDIRK